MKLMATCRMGPERAWRREEEGAQGARERPWQGSGNKAAISVEVLRRVMAIAYLNCAPEELTYSAIPAIENPNWGKAKLARQGPFCAANECTLERGQEGVRA